MSAIVPYMAENPWWLAKRVASNAGMYPAYKRMRTASGVAQMANYYGPQAKWAAKKLQRAFRGRKKNNRMHQQAKQRVGKEPGTATTKRHVANATDVASRDTRTLYSFELTDIPHTSTNNVASRDRHIVNIKGFKLDIAFKNVSAIPLYLNVAVVFDKRGNDTVSVVSVNDFYRGNGSTRAADFSVNFSALELHTKPLNADRFTIYSHDRFLLGTSNQTVAQGFQYTQNFMHFKKWIPLNKQISYEDDNAQSKIWLIYWCDQMHRDSATAAVAGVLETQQYDITYFKEVCC